MPPGVDLEPGHKAVLDDLLLDDARVRPGKTLGHPAFYAGRKLALSLYGQGVGVRLPETTAARLLETDGNVTPFQPMGRRRMRDWVQIDVGRAHEVGRCTDGPVRGSIAAGERRLVDVPSTADVIATSRRSLALVVSIHRLPDGKLLLLAEHSVEAGRGRPGAGARGRGRPDSNTRARGWSDRGSGRRG